MALQTNIVFQVTSDLTKVMDLLTAKTPMDYSQKFNWPDGSAANQATKIFHDKRQLAASTSEELDLNASLLDAYGAVIAFTKIRGLVVRALSTNSNDVQVGGSAINGFNSWVGAVGDLVVVKPGGLLSVIGPDVSGYAVTAGTGDLLKIANSGAGSVVDYEIIIIGS